MRDWGDYFLGGGVENITLSGSGAEPEVLKSARVSADFLSILEVHPLLGRPFRHEEDTEAGPRVTMISSELWHRRFGGDAAILGKTATLGATPYTIVGVLPPDFQFPFPDVDVWITRPSEDVSSNSPVTAHPGMLDGKPTAVEHVTPLRDRLVANVRLLLWMLFGAAGFVLLIACANVASLLLAHAAGGTLGVLLARWRSAAASFKRTDAGGQRRLALGLAGGFGGVVLLMAMIAIYGVMAYSVAQRTPAMGIRRALSAHMRTFYGWRSAEVWL